MSIAEKLTTVAENVPKVYKAGQDSMVDPDKIITKSTSGNPVYLDDVSEIPHNVGITLSSDTIIDFSDVNVTVCGKNLIPESKYPSSVTYSGVTFTYEGDGVFCINGTFDNSSGTTNAAITAYVLNNASIQVDDGLTYTLCVRVLSGSYSGTTNPFIPYMALDSNTVTRKNWLFVKLSSDIDNQTKYASGVPSTTLADANCVSKFWFYHTAYSGETITYSDYRVQVWLTKGLTAIDYEPYKGTTYTASADGTVEGVTSLSPYMNIYSDADVDIKVDYHKSYGMQTEYDRFWDNIQDNGNRVQYQYAFYCGTGAKTSMWNDETFKPKYDIKPTRSSSVFYGAGFTDFKAILDKQGVVFDTSNSTHMDNMFGEAYRITHIPEISAVNATNLGACFGYCEALVTIDKLIISAVQTTTFTNTFRRCISLRDILFEGLIQSSIDFQYSPLSVESMKSIIGCLADYSTQNTGTYTVTFKEDCWSALEADSTAPDGGAWKDYVRNLGWLV